MAEYVAGSNRIIRNIFRNTVTLVSMTDNAVRNAVRSAETLPPSHMIHTLEREAECLASSAMLADYISCLLSL